MKVRVYEYLGRKRSFIFLVGPRFDSFVTIKGRKRVNLKRLFMRTTLKERDPECKYQEPDKELLIDMIVPPNKLRDASRKKRI